VIPLVKWSRSPTSKRRPSSSSILARAEGENKTGEAAAVTAPLQPATPPPADESNAREGLNYVAHSYGSGRLSSEEEDGASVFFWFVKGESRDDPLTTRARTRTQNTHTQNADLDVLEIKDIRHMLKKR